MASRFTVEQRKAGEIIVEAGTEPNKLFVVVDGTIELATDGPHNTRLRKALLGEGGYFGDEALLGAPYKLPSAKPLSDATLLVLDLAKLDEVSGLREGITHSLDRRQILLDQVNEFGETRIDLLSGHVGEPKLPTTFVDFAEYSREYHLSTIQTILQTHTRITDLYSNEIDQLREQVRVTIDAVKEREEWDLINNPDFGLLHEVAPGQRIPTRSGPSTPDDLDELLTKVWKKPAFFLAHPEAIAAFGREATRRGVPPVIVHFFGSPFLTWRGVPLVPTNKLPIKGGSNSVPATMSILLLRVGEGRAGRRGPAESGRHR